MTTDEALLRLGESTARAVAGVLSAFVGEEDLQQGVVMVVPYGESPLKQIPVPAVAASVSYVDGVTGGNVFVISLAGAKRLAAAMMGLEPEEGDLTELELSAIGEAMNQMMAAAAAATTATLGQEVEISTPETRFFATPSDAAAAFDEAPHATTVSFSLHGETCRLIQLVPNAFVVRMTRALQDLAIDLTGVDVETGGGALSRDVLRDVPVRVWAELGRARLPLGVAVGLAPGAVVELDRGADEPVDLYVSGRLFGRGVLVLVDDGEWAVRVQELVPVPQIANPPEGETL
jgi:flagellar motor switch protein FliN